MITKKQCMTVLLFSVISYAHALRISNTAFEPIHVLLEVPNSTVLFDGIVPSLSYTTIELCDTALCTNDVLYMSITMNNEDTAALQGKLIEAQKMNNSDELIIVHRQNNPPFVFLINEQPSSQTPSPSWLAATWLSLKQTLARLTHFVSYQQCKQ